MQHWHSHSLTITTFRMLLQRYPVFRVFLALCVGILLANFVDLPFHFFLTLLGVSIGLVVFLAFYMPVFFSFRLRWIFGLFSAFTFFLLGVFVTELYTERHFKNYLTELPEKKVYALVQLLEDPQEKERSMGMKTRLIQIGSSTDSLEIRSLKLMLYLKKDSASRELRYGDQILLHSYLNELQAPKNPFEFDYRDFLNLKAIYAQAYAAENGWKKVSSHNGWAILKYSKDLRRYLLTVVDSWKLNEVQTAVTKALLLGYRYDIDDNTLKAYASAGAMHVLAVSGLHVGIVYIMAGYLLFFLMKVKHGAAVKSVILILLLWGFAMLTGMSASVVRAATMFTFVAIGTGFQRNTSIYNTILGSAMLLMVIRPTYLFEVGFQLSYAAVFGIVWMQPHLSKLWRPPNKVFKMVWDITTVSLAAQLATFPLGLYYFHQFPTLFLISNLVVIPVVTGLMYLGVPVLVLSGMGLTIFPLVKLYSGLMWVMNTAVIWIEKQASFLISEIHISRWELVILYVLIISGFWWLIRGGYRKVLVSAMAILALCISQLIEQRSLTTAETLVVYAVKGHTAIGLYGNQGDHFYSDSTFLKDDDALTFHVKHHWWALDAVPQLKVLNPDSLEARFFSIKNELLYFMDGNEKQVPKVDYILTNGQAPAKNLTIAGNPKFILNTSLKYYDLPKWTEWCETQNLTYHDLSSEGAFVYKPSPANGDPVAWLAQQD